MGKRKINLIHQKNLKRYRLHQVIKQYFKYSPREYVVFISHNFNHNQYPKKVSKALTELQQLNYSLQTEIGHE